MEQQTYTIREMSERFGLPASTLRYYEEIGLLTDVIHTESKKRIYTQQHIDCMTAILCFKRTGCLAEKISKWRKSCFISREILTRWLPFSKNMSRIYAKKSSAWNPIWSIFNRKCGITARFAMRLKMGMKCRRGIPAAVRRRRSRYLSRLFRRRHTQVSKEQVRKGTNIHFSYLLFLFFLSPFPFIPGIFSAFPA